MIPHINDTRIYFIELELEFLREDLLECIH